MHDCVKNAEYAKNSDTLCHYIVYSNHNRRVAQNITDVTFIRDTDTHTLYIKIM